MTASLPFYRALAAPDRALPRRAVGAAVLAAPVAESGSVRIASKPLSAARVGPVPQGAAGLVAPLVAVAPPAPSRPVGKLAMLVSSGLHLMLLGGWAVLAAPARPLMPPDLELAQVELVSEAAFAALTAPQPAAPPVPAALAEVPDLAAKAGLEAVLPETPQSETSQPEMPLPKATAPELLPAAPEEAPPQLAEAAPPPKPKAEQPKAKQPKAQEPKAQKTKAEKPKAEKKAAAAPKQQEKSDVKPGKPGAKSGAAAAKPAQGASKGEAKALKADWGGKVRSRINRKVGAAKGAGTVKVRLSLTPTGALLGAAIAQSSGVAELDAAALRAVKSAVPYPRAPKGLSDASYTFTLPITFKG